MKMIRAILQGRMRERLGHNAPKCINNAYPYLEGDGSFEEVGVITYSSLQKEHPVAGFLIDQPFKMG